MMTASSISSLAGKNGHEVPVLVSSSSLFNATAAPSADSVTARLKKEEFTVASTQKGIKRYDVVRVASNSPSEDDFVHAIMSDPLSVGKGKDWSAWGIFDGHV
jgi:hypothetical protein